MTTRIILITVIVIIIMLLIIYIIHGMSIRFALSSYRNRSKQSSKSKKSTNNHRNKVNNENKKKNKVNNKNIDPEEELSPPDENGNVTVEKIKYQDTYIVTVGKKTADNKFHGTGSENCFYINGVEAPKVMMQRNVYYRFENKTEEPFYFTTSVEGGLNEEGTEGKDNLSKNVKNFKGFANGTIYFMVSDDLPDNFYYQSSSNLYMGSVIILLS